MKNLSKVFLTLVFVLSLVPQHVAAAPLYQTACEQDVTVQADDWLSNLAEKFYGDLLAFPAIVEATNAAGGDYATITNPDIIEAGWKLCIPSGADAQALLGDESGAAMASSGVETPGDPSELSSVVWGNFNPNYLANVLNELADENGWLQDYGMADQEMVIMDQELVFPALLGGSLNMALQDTDAVAGAQLAGADLIYIANYRDKEPWIMSFQEGVDINNLAGITCSGGGAGGRNEFNAKEMVKRLGGDPEQIEWIPIGGGSDSRVNAFVEGQIDCVQHFDRHRVLATDAGGTIVYDELENVPQDGFVVTREFAEANPRFVINYLKGIIKARRVLNDLGNKDEIIEIMRARGYEIPQAFVDQYDRQMNIINDSENFEIAAMETLIVDSVRTGSLEESIDWREFVDMTYLEQAYRELGMESEIQDYSGGAMASGVETPGDPSELSSVVWGNFNPNYLANVLNELADENGWLQDYGMADQEMVIMDQELVFPALLGGSLNMALQDTDAVAGAQLAGADLIYIANYRDKEPWIMSFQEGVDINNLAGITCSGGGAGGRNEFNAKEMVKRLGGDPEQIEWIPIGGGSDSRVNAFVEGQIDCVQHFDRHRVLATDAGGTIVYDELENVPQDGFVVTREFAEANPRFVINYLKGIIKARRVLNDLGNKDEIIEIMRARGYEIPQAFVDQYDRQMNIINDSENFEIAAMETLIVDSVRTGSLEESIDWRQFVDMTYLAQAYKELGMESEIQSYE